MWLLAVGIKVLQGPVWNREPFQCISEESFGLGEWWFGLFSSLKMPKAFAKCE